MPIVSAKGKRRLYFSTNDSEKLWRFKEKVVAVIELYFQDIDDVNVFSPARISNIVGDFEEIDVAYSTIADPSEYFEFIQVRDRSDIQGRPWLEQIVGQRTTLGLNSGKMVSTTDFSKPAIRLAKELNIALRLLLPESIENIKSWYSSDSLGTQTPMIEIDHSSILIARDDKVYELKADGKKCIEKNILTLTNEPNKYKLMSLKRVFDVDIMNRPDNENEFIGKLPEDNLFHNASVGIEYEEAKLFIRFDGKITDGVEVNQEILPIVGIVFFVKVNRKYADHPISYRFKYMNALNNKLLAQIIISEVIVDDKRHYSCLLRYDFEDEEMRLGGAFFR